MVSVAAAWVESSARRALVRLHDRFGAPGLAVAAGVPGLAAEVDQHAAAVRDILSFGVDRPASVSPEVLLAGYARGLVDALRELGGLVAAPVDAAGWLRADWSSLRLLGVCALAASPASLSGDPALPAV